MSNNITLKLQDIVLKGISTNNRALVLVSQGGKLILESGAKVTMNSNISTGYGGGIYVNGGILELYIGCEIENNIQNHASTPSGGGGIFIYNQGNVNMYGGLISGNKTGNGGGGINIYGNSSMTMSGGIILNNVCQGGYWARGGGIGIFDSGSSFTKHAISGNNTSGIIYGGIGDNANIANSGGHALYRDSGSKKLRNTTLGIYDEISTLSDVGWE